MKIAVVGTSNGVLNDGYGRFLVKDASSHQVDNFSIGAVCSLYANYIIDKKMIAEEYDICVLDFCINDQSLCDSEYLSLEQSASFICSLISKFCCSRCIPIILLLVYKKYMSSIDESAVYTNTVRLAEFFGVRTVNFAKYIYDTCVSAQVDGVYRDDAHYAPKYQQLISDFIVYELTRKPGPSPRKIFDYMKIGLVNLEKPEYINCIKTTKETSLVSVEVKKMNIDSRILMNNRLWLCGILYWSSSSTGGLIIKNASRMIFKNLHITHGGLTLGILFHQVIADNLEIVLGCSPQQSCVFDPTAYSCAPASEPNNSEVDIVDCVFSNLDLSISGRFLLNFVDYSETCLNSVSIDSLRFDENKVAAEVGGVLERLSRAILGDNSFVTFSDETTSLLILVLAKLSFLDCLQKTLLRDGTIDAMCSKDVEAFIGYSLECVKSSIDQNLANHRYLCCLNDFCDIYRNKILDCRSKNKNDASSGGDLRLYYEEVNRILRIEILNLFCKKNLMRNLLC